MSDITLSEEAVCAIGGHITTWLREFTSDINKAISDVPEDAKKQRVKIGATIILDFETGKILPVIDLKLQTGKVIKDQVIVDVNAAPPGT